MMYHAPLLLFNFLGPEMLVILLATIPFFFFRSKRGTNSILQPFQFAGTPNFSQSNVGAFLTGGLSQSTGSWYRSDYIKLSAIYGFGFGIVSLILSRYLSSYNYQYGGGAFESISILFTIGISFLALYFCIRHLRNRNSGKITRKSILIIGVVFGVANGLATTLGNYIYFFLIDPYAFEEMMYYDISARTFFLSLLMGIPVNAFYDLVFSFILSFFIKTQ